jgi:hypothetical protein
VKNATVPGLPPPVSLGTPKTVTSSSREEDGGDPALVAPATDLLLRETENILADYLHLSNRPDSLVVTKR